MASDDADLRISDESFSTDNPGSDFVGEDDSRDEVKKVQELAQQESRNVRTWRCLVFLALLSTSAVVTALTYFFLNNEDEDDFDTAFGLFASSIEDSVEFYFKGVVEATEGLSEMLTAYAESSGSQWPFVTLPNFEVYARRLRSQANIEMIYYSPIVQGEMVEAWWNYSFANQGWVNESFAVTEDKERVDFSPLLPFVYTVVDNEIVPAVAAGGYPTSPTWQFSPPPNSVSYINFDGLSDIAHLRPVYDSFEDYRGMLLGVARDVDFIGFAFSEEEHDEYHSDFKRADAQPGFANEHPHTTLFFPISEKLGDPTSDLVGIIRAVLPWDKYLEGLLPGGVDGIYVVLRNDCDQSYTYVVNGKRAEFVGDGDFHDAAYNRYEYKVDLNAFLGDRNETIHGGFGCVYSLSVYPSDVLYGVYDSRNPLIYSVVVASATLLMGITFLIYDLFVQRKNQKIIGMAAISNAIVSSLFPSNVRDRLFNQGEVGNKTGSAMELNKLGKHGLKSFLAGSNERGSDETDDDGFKTKPIADLFPDTTVMFADLVGFTAWSSVREPSQVFTLLETVYHSFDQIARARRVFKVETVGDCYVAVTGLPDPRKDHAVAMARFAQDCLRKIGELTKKLEVTLGPDTGDLSVRVGLHSGPVTAGVLRGERSRFQLFGDTMNTASRMESTGKKGQIQVSQETADLLIAANKAHWLSLREDKVVAKGKGELQTYWLDISTGPSSSGGSSGHGEGDSMSDVAVSVHTDHPENVQNLLSGKVARLIDWNSEVLGRLLKQIVFSRQAAGHRVSTSDNSSHALAKTRVQGGTVLDEVKEIITLPEFNARMAKRHTDFESMQLPDAVDDQLRFYIRNIAALYRDNPFHNFEHASHVTMSVVKLLSRIVAPTDIEYEVDSKKKVASMLHDHTYGITSDPLTQFACALSALIHDVDHMGVPNTQLIQENPELGMLYKNKSVAEQNSVDLAWDLLMEDNFVDLRNAICATSSERQRFRQLVVNSVMATDIMDKDLKELRNARWDKAFTEGHPDSLVSVRDNVNRKATIVIEHLIQASDVAHTMQHWHIYRKWNERLFREMTLAYKQGRAKTDPAENWYQGELGFFDFYIIPLAKKLKECGVFGVSSAEYLDYAEKNREEWEERGKEVVAEMLETLKLEEDVAGKD